MDLLRHADTLGHGRRRRDHGGHHRPVSFTHGAGRAQELDVRNIRCALGGCGWADVAFREDLPVGTCTGSAMSAHTTMEQQDLVGFTDDMVDRFCRGLFGTTRANVS